VVARILEADVLLLQRHFNPLTQDVVADLQLRILLLLHVRLLLQILDHEQRPAVPHERALAVQALYRHLLVERPLVAGLRREHALGVHLVVLIHLLLRHAAYAATAEC